MAQQPARVVLCESQGRGRGLAAASAIAAGEPILCEAAAASAVLDNGASNPWSVAGQLVVALIATGAADSTRDLEPREASAQIVPSGEAEQIETAVGEVRGHAAAASVGPDVVCRLLHVVVRNALQLCDRQARALRVRCRFAIIGG